MRIEQVVQHAVSKVDRSSARAIENKAGITTEARSDDSVELSRSAELLRTANTNLSRIPEVRPEKIAQAMARMQEGSYNTPEVREKIALALAGSPALTGDVTEARQAKQAKVSSDERTDRVTETKKRATEGFYDTPEVRDAIAESVIEAVIETRVV
jgi:anti-sigma28 factor (negative regulator of flagellin synthesis)